MDNYNYGIRNEDRLAAALQRRGYSVKYSVGSRGAADISADKGGRHWEIQVKAVSTGVVRAETDEDALEVLQGRLSRTAETRLLRSAGAQRRRAAAALVNGDYFWLWELDRVEYRLVYHGWLPSRPLDRDD